MSEAKHVVLGAGVTGLSAAAALAKIYGSRVLLVEQQPEVGGLAATLQRDGLVFDLGSHRIHPTCNPEILETLRDLLGPDLLRRERHGRIFVEGRCMPYPPRPLDVAAAFGWGRAAHFFAGSAAAAIQSRFARPRHHSFEACARARVGAALYKAFYEPYALKLWGLPPVEISDEPARKRVRSRVLGDAARNFMRKRAAEFYYPAGGIGQIAERLKERFLACGGVLALETALDKVRCDENNHIRSVLLRRGAGGGEEAAVETLTAAVPIPAIYSALQADFRGEHRPLDLKWRALRIVVLRMPGGGGGEMQTYYLPDRGVLIGRVSEIAKYSPALGPKAGERLLTVEVVCSRGDEVWSMAEPLLVDRCLAELRRFEILKSGDGTPLQTVCVNLEHVYPVYQQGWAEEFRRLRRFYALFPNLVAVGRSALFMHCNIDHCMHMGARAAEFIAARRDPSGACWDDAIDGFLDYYVRE